MMMQNYTIMKLLLLQFLLSNLETALSIKENYNTIVQTVDDLLGYTDVKQKLNGKTNNLNSNPVHFYTRLTSASRNEFPWKTSTSNERKKLKGLSQLAEPSISTHIVNYNRTTLPKCPSGFYGLPYPDNSNYSICYLVTERTSFPPQCPYPTTVDYNFPPRYFPLTDEKQWAFTYKNVSNIGKKNCFVTKGKIEANLTPATCTEKYPGVCAYSDMNFQEPTFTDYCTSRYNNTHCIGTFINSPLRCYCKTDRNKLPRTEFCNTIPASSYTPNSKESKKLVEITNPYENNFLLKLLGNQERCWIGLHKNKDLYQWSSTNATSNYTFWSTNTDFSKIYGALGADGWLLEEDGALNCAICEIEVEDHPQVHIHIQHTKTRNVLNVTIENATGVFQEVLCFSQNSNNYKTIDMRGYIHNFLRRDIQFSFSTSGYYWCKALQIPNLTPVYSNTIFITTKTGHEYAVLITFSQPDTSLPESTADMACSSMKSLNAVFFDSRPIKVIKRNEDDKTLEVLCHITISSTKLSRAQEFDMISKLLKSDKITNLASVEVCLPSNTTSGSQTLNWLETPIGVTTIPEELCLQEDGSPVMRTCKGNFYYGGHWSDVNGSCADVTYSNRTHLLYNLLISQNITQSNLTMAILNITANSNNFTSFEIHLVSKVLEKLANFDEHISVVNITNTVNNIMHLKPNNLRVAQEILNSTDMILYSLDKMLAQTEINNSGYTSAITDKLVVQVSDLKKTNIIGIKLEKTKNCTNVTNPIPIHQGTSQEDLIKEDFDVAVLIPQQLHTERVKYMDDKTSSNLITTIFKDNVLFKEHSNTNNHASGTIIGLTIPAFNSTFTTPLQIIFNSATNNNTRLKCASWLYGFKDVTKSTYGQWFIEGDPKSVENSSYQVCEFTHITHFTLLILGDTNEISEAHKKALDVITAVGSGLSILGLLMVFLTAIMFKRFGSANAIVINFSIATTAQIVLLLVADNVPKQKVLCIVFGAALHYTVLSHFCWTLTIAVLQYRRYVVVLSNPPRHMVAKACACCWGTPLIPVIIIISISRDNYGEYSNGLCYARGDYFTFGVVIPVLLIILVNLIVFLKIMLSIASSRKINVHQKRDDTFSLQLRLAIMLFFVLGLTWGFGLLAAIGGGIVYSYLFCITATLQGFILFLYFIVLNEKHRSLWRNMKICSCKIKGGKSDVNTDSAARAMINQKSRNTTTPFNSTISSTTTKLL